MLYERRSRENNSPECQTELYTEAKRCFATHDKDIDYYFKDSSLARIKFRGAVG